MFKWLKKYLGESKPEIDAIMLEKTMIQIEICYEYRKFQKMHDLMTKAEKQTNQFLEEHDWPEEALDSFLKGRNKIRWLHDPSFQSRMLLELRQWSSQNGL